MKKEQSLLHILCQERIYVGQPLKILVEVNFIRSTPITSLTGFFKGQFHTKISNQIEFRQIVAFKIGFDTLTRQWPIENGEIYVPAGKHTAETNLAIGQECPGSYLGKYGSIEYFIAVELCIPARPKLIQMRPVKVIAVMDITRYLPFHIPVHIERYFHKKLLCLNKSSIKVFIKMSKAAFVPGEMIVVDGEIGNEYGKNSIKGGIVRLIMVVRFRCKGNEKFTSKTLSYFMLPFIPQCSIIAFQHFLQIPINAFPTYCHPDALINLSYHISVILNECKPIKIPLIIGTGIPIQFINTQNYPSSLSSIANFSTMLLQSQTFPPLIINSLQHLPPSTLSIPSFLLSVSSPFSYSEFDKSLDSTVFSSCKCNQVDHSQVTFTPGESPITRYKGQSILRIEEIE
ncbi:Arrestin (or S-antigen) N-terminal domain family protein [Brugia pahangi]